MRQATSCSLSQRPAAAALALGAAVALLLALPGPVKAEKEGLSRAGAETSGDAALLSEDYKRSNHELVIITEEDLKPRLMVLEEGQLVAWINYSDVASTVVFEREVAKSMICHSLVNFSLKKGEIRSEPLEAGQFASFCELKPGRYQYKVVRDVTQDPFQPTVPKEWLVDAKSIYGEIVVGNVDQE